MKPNPASQQTSAMPAAQHAQEMERAALRRRRLTNAGVAVFVAGAFTIALAIAFVFASIWQPPAGLAGGFEFFATGSLLLAVGGVGVGVGAALVRRGVR